MRDRRRRRATGGMTQLGRSGQPSNVHNGHEIASQAVVARCSEGTSRSRSRAARRGTRGQRVSAPIIGILPGTPGPCGSRRLRCNGSNAQGRDTSRRFAGVCSFGRRFRAIFIRHGQPSVREPLKPPRWRHPSRRPTGPRPGGQARPVAAAAQLPVSPVRPRSRSSGLWRPSEPRCANVRTLTPVGRSEALRRAFWRLPGASHSGRASPGCRQPRFRHPSLLPTDLSLFLRTTDRSSKVFFFR